MTGEETKALAELLAQVGVAGILLYLLLLAYKRYDDLGERLGKRVDEINEKRVEDAKQTAVVTERMLDLVAKITENTAKQTKEISELGEALVKAVRDHDLAGETTIREARKPRDGSGRNKPGGGGS